MQKKEEINEEKDSKNRKSISVEELKNFYSAGGYAKIKKIKDGIKGFISQVTIQENREIVKDYHSEALINWINNSTHLEWDKKPAFLKAVIKELLDRIANFTQ